LKKRKLWKRYSVETIRSIAAAYGDTSDNVNFRVG
jgi:hypothetical protein